MSYAVPGSEYVNVMIVTNKKAEPISRCRRESPASIGGLPYETSQRMRRPR